MIHHNFVATILTILLVGTIPTTLLLSSYSNSGLEIGTFSTYNFAHAAEKMSQTDKIDKQNVNPVSSEEKLQQKAKQLMLEAINAKTKAAEAVDAVGNATERADALSSIADEADREVRALVNLVDDVDNKLQQSSNKTEAEEQQNNLNNYDKDHIKAAISEANEKRKEANLAEKDAKDLSDKADSLIKAANRAERLAGAAEKELKHATSESNGNNERTTNTNRVDENVKASSKKDINVVESDNGNASTLGLVNEAKHPLRIHSEQSPITSIVNDSVEKNQEQRDDGFPVGTLGVNSSSTNTNEISLLGGEPDRNINNFTAPDNEATGEHLLGINPFGNSPDYDSIPVSPSENNTQEFEGNINCKVRLDIATKTSIDTIDGEDGGCYPQTSESGRYQYVVWSEGDEDNRFILFKRSVNNRVVEDAITLSGNIPSAAFNPKVTSEGRNVYVVWQGDSESGNQDILMRKSDNYGESFGDVINLSNDGAGSGNPEINVNSSNVYVAWDGTTPGNNDIYLRKSVNNGSDFDKVRNLSANKGVSYEPKVVLDKKGVQIYWRDYRDGQEEILARKSLNEGRTFEALKNIDKDVLDLWKDRAVSAGRS